MSTVLATAVTALALCSGEAPSPLLTCHHRTNSPDIRLYVQEFQACENGKITSVDRSLTGFYVKPTPGGDKILTIDTNVNPGAFRVTYASKRTTFPDRGDDLSIVLPESATMRIGDSKFVVTVSQKTAPDYEGATEDQRHFVGAFKQTNKAGQQVASGSLICTVD